MFRRVISLLLTMVLLVGTVPPVQVRAEETVEETVAETVVETVTETTEGTTAPVESTMSSQCVETAPETVMTEETLLSLPEYAPNIPGEEPAEELLPVEIPISDSITANNEDNKCGENAYWSLSGNVLYITGTGVVDVGSPWDGFQDSIYKVVVSEGITDLNCIFFAYGNLTEVVLPSTLRSLGMATFASCVSLSEITLPENLYSIGMSCFSNCAIRTITMPKSLTEIPMGAFYGCQLLQEIVIPAGVTTIGDSAFAGCYSLAKVTLPNGLKSIGSSAFWGCAFSELVLPETLETIGESAFYGCDSWANVYIPASVKSIGKDAFHWAWYRRKFEVSLLNPYYCNDAYGALYDKGKTTLLNVPALLMGEYPVPDTVRTVEDHAFTNCAYLTAVEFKGNVQSIGKEAFMQCSKLKGITFTGNAPTFAEDTFTNTRTTVYYPGKNTTWTESVMQDYGGTITWVPVAETNIVITMDEDSMCKLPLVCGTVYYSELKSACKILYPMLLVEPSEPFNNVTITFTLPDGFSFEENKLVAQKTQSWNDIKESCYLVMAAVYPIYIDNAKSGDTFSVKIEPSGTTAKGKKWVGETIEEVLYKPSEVTCQAKSLCPNIQAEDYHFTLDTATGSGTTYNKETARLCAMMADMAYDRVNMEKFLTEEMGFSDFERQGISLDTDPMLSVLGRYYASKKIIENGKLKNLVYVVCRGTPGLPREWIANVITGWGDTHAGFEFVAMNVQRELLNYCQKRKFIPEDTIIVVTGHSRGAAVANLVGNWLNHLAGIARKENISVYTFATPTVDKTIVSEAKGYAGNENIFNFVNYQDIIRNSASMKYYGRYGDTRLFAYGTGTPGEEYYFDGYWTYPLPNNGTDYTLNEMFNSVLYDCDTSSPLSIGKALIGIANLIKKRVSLFDSGLAELGGAHAMSLYYLAVLKDAPDTPFAVANQRTEEIRDFVWTWAEDLQATLKDFIMYSYKCPINLYVYDDNGNIVASIVDKQVTCSDENLIVYVNGESLNVGYFESDRDNYSIKIEGYDDGTMKHCIQTINLDGVESVQIRKDIPITDGGILEVNGEGIVVIPGESDADALAAYTTYTEESEIEEVLNSLNHTHEFGGWTQTKAPGCVEAGSEERTCATCGEVEKRDIDPLGHDYATWSGETSCRVCGEKFGVDILQEYLAIRESVQLTAEVTPSELAEKISWSVEKGGEDIISVDAAGNVTPLSVGTAYVTASVTDGELILSDRCRIDVAAPVEIDGIQLSTNKVTTELFSTDYSEFEILLQLPQNLSMSSDAEAVRSSDEDWGVSIESAEFENWDMAGVFELKVLDDRRVAVVPTDYAVYFPEEVKNSYVTTVQVKINGEIYTSEKMTLTVKRSKPKLKATVPTFNSFYSWQEQKISVAGGTVTEIDGTVPDWLFMYDDTLQLESDIPLKNLSGKAVLEIYTEEWRIPATVSVAVKSVYKPPALKLNVSSVTLCQDSSDSQGVQLQIQSKEKGVDIADLKIKAVLAEENYLTENLNPEDGTFTLIPIDDFPSGKVTLNVSFEDTINDVPLSLTVKNTPVNLKLSKSAITLNSGTGDSVVVGVDITPVDFIPEDLDFRLVGNDKSDRLYSGELDVEYKDGKLYISTTDQTPDNAKYTLYISAAGGKETALKITTTNAEPTLKLKANGNLDLSFPDRKIALTTTFKNHSGGNLTAINYTVTEASGKTVLNEDSKAIQLTKDGADLFVQLKDTTGINIKNTYTLNLKLTLADDSVLASSVKIPVKQTNISLKLSANKLTLNKAIDDKATVTVTCATKDYNFIEPVWILLDSKGREVEAGILDISWTDGKLTVATTEATPYGDSYKLQISPEEGAKAVALAIVIPAEAKSTITGTLKTTGNLDVIRDGTALTITPTWKNCNDAERTEILTIRNGSGEDVTAQFVIEEENGKYILTRAGALDHTQKYTATLTATFTNGTTATATGALKLKMGSAKLTVNTDSTTLFANDKHSRVNVSFASIDHTLNGVAKVTLDPKLANQFELFDYGNGQYAIGFKNGTVPAKVTSVNLALNVWLEGNETAKANVSVKVKLSIVR